MIVQTILASHAIPGMITAEDIFNDFNQLIVPKNTVLTNRTIIRIQFYSILNIKIFSTQEKEEEVEPERTFMKELKESDEYKNFQDQFSKLLNTLKYVFSGFKDNGISEMMKRKLMYETNSLISECRNSMHVFHVLNCMHDYDDITFSHSLNVSIICNLIGKRLNFSDSENNVLTLCGLFHDIGKLLIPQNLLVKTSPLTDREFDIIKTHPIQGYIALKPYSMNQHILYSALMHHEKCDGSGYPNGFKTQQIDKYARIVTIADVYDAMTSIRAYRDALCPFDVINLFETEGYRKYDTNYLITFLEMIAETYINNNVRLSDNRVGKIIMINKNAISKPVVQVQNKFIDLSVEPSLTIIKII